MHDRRVWGRACPGIYHSKETDLLFAFAEMDDEKSFERVGALPRPTRTHTYTQTRMHTHIQTYARTRTSTRTQLPPTRAHTHTRRRRCRRRRTQLPPKHTHTCTRTQRLTATTATTATATTTTTTTTTTTPQPHTHTTHNTHLARRDGECCRMVPTAAPAPAVQTLQQQEQHLQQQQQQQQHQQRQQRIASSKDDRICIRRQIIKCQHHLSCHHTCVRGGTQTRESRRGAPGRAAAAARCGAETLAFARCGAETPRTRPAGWRPRPPLRPSQTAPTAAAASNGID